MTGERLDGDVPRHPVYVVKIDNTSNSAPQVGLGSADLVVEELVEGGLTRLAAFFYQETPDKVGPVRSMRASDVGIVKPVNATIVASGAAPRTTRALAAAKVDTLTEGKRGFSRDTGRVAPYNLFVAFADVANHPGHGWKPPAKAYLRFGDESGFRGRIPVRRIAADFGNHTTDWSYADKHWTRPGSYAKTGDDFAADNVLLLRVRLGDAGYLDPAGNPVPVTRLTGTGKGVLVHREKALACRWSKKRPGSQLTLIDKSGRAVAVPPGHTWIELVPAKTGKVVLTG